MLSKYIKKQLIPPIFNAFPSPADLPSHLRDLKMEKGTPLTIKKSLRKSSIIAGETKKVQKTPQARKTQNTPLEKHIQHYGNRNLDFQKNKEINKENSSKLINSVSLHNNIETPKNIAKHNFSSVHFDRTANEADKKMSTDSDIEFSDKMKKRKKINVETNNTGIDLNNRKSVRFMSTKTVIHPTYMNALPEELQTFESTYEARKCEERKSTPFVKRSKSSVITIDSTTTTKSFISESSQNHPTTPSALKSSITPMKPFTQKHDLTSFGEGTPHVRSIARDRPKRKTWSPQKYSYLNLGTPNPASKASATPMKLSIHKEGSKSAIISTEKSNKKRTAKLTPYVRHSVYDRPKRKSRSPVKYSCVNLVTPNSSTIDPSLRREGTFLVDSPSIVIVNDTKSKIQDSFNESKAGSNGTKRQRRKWDKSDKNWTEPQSKNQNQFSAHAPLESPPPLQEFSKRFNKDMAKFCSTPFQHHKATIPDGEHCPDNMPSAIKIRKPNVPNFAAIHQRNFQKMENIQDLVERKAKELNCFYQVR
nr:unnamed protein product [Callosobruchus analis]